MDLRFRKESNVEMHAFNGTCSDGKSGIPAVADVVGADMDAEGFGGCSGGCRGLV